MRDPHVTTEAHEAAVAEAYELLRPLTKPARSWSIINWNDAHADNDPRDEFQAAVEFVIALLDPAKPKSSAQAETYDSRAQHLADELLGAHASIVRKVILPALRLGRMPKQKGQRRGGHLLRDRWIAAVVTTICQQHGLNPYRNPESNHTYNGFSVVAEALKRLGIRLGVGLAEKSVEKIYTKHRQA
jgi:hypothetical protein